MSADGEITIVDLWRRVEEKFDIMDRKQDRRFDELRVAAQSFATKEDIELLGEGLVGIEVRVQSLEDDRTERGAWSKLRVGFTDAWQRIFYPALSIGIALAAYVVASTHHH